MRTRLTFLWFLLAPAALGAQGWILPRPCVRPLDDRVDVRVPTCPGQAIVRTRSDVRARIDAGRAIHYEVEERFVNRGGALGEADYMFPLPKGAAFADLKLSINGELVAGETMNANDARRIYEDIVRRKRDPALVEWMGHGLLRARIFPINPGEEKRVVVRFDAVAEREGDALRVDYFRGGAPTGAVMPVENGVSESARTSFTISYERTASLGMPYSPTHSLDMSDEGRTRRIDVRGDARDVTLLFPIPRADAPAISTLAYAPGGEDGFALITLSPPSDRSRRATPRDVTFVLDVSGSMAGRKMEQARAAGRQLLSTLRDGDRFRIIDFATDVRSFRDDFVFATSNNLREANKYLDALEASGSTNISGALTEALRSSRRERYYPIDRADDGESDRPRVDARRMPVVLFVTDGAPTVGERDPEAIAQLASRNRGDARVFTFGLGSDVNVALLERLAMEGRGTAQFVRPDESVERMVGVVASRLVDPVLTDVRVRTDGDVHLSKMLPGQPIDLFAGQDLVLLARYSGDGPARVVFEGRRGDETVRWTSRVDFPERERENPFVARLWATQRVGYLAAEKRRSGASKEIDDEIRSLGERFGIPTEFTSYLVQEPQTVAMNQAVGRRVAGGVAGQPAASPAPSVADKSFAAAKTAAEQRAATSLAQVDSMRVAYRSRDDAASTRRIESRTFELRGDVWTDVRYRDGTRTLHVQAYSRAYFELIDKLPDLRAVFALGDKVVVMGRVAAIQLDAKASEPSTSDVAWTIANW